MRSYSWELESGSGTTPPALLPGADDLPTVGDIVAPGQAAQVRLRHSTSTHLATGRYAEVYAGWAAQCQICLARLADEAMSARLPTATREALLDLVASEFNTVVDPLPQKSNGSVTLVRVRGTGAALGPGLIRPGTKFRKAGDSKSSPQVASASYVVVEPCYVHATAENAQQIVVRIQATQAGAASNKRSYDPDLALADTLFDTRFVVFKSDSAGGSDGVSDDKLRAIANAVATGQYGPTLTAATVGLLETAGVSHVASHEPGDGTVFAWVADDSWACSAQLMATAKQNLYDNYLGFGCKACVGSVEDTLASVSATVILRDKRYMADTMAEDATGAPGVYDNVRAALVKYFNGRPDWYTWKLSGVGIAIARADRRILRVEDVVVKDALGAAVPEPSSTLPTDYDSVLTDTPVAIKHYQLDDTNMTLTFDY